MPLINPLSVTVSSDEVAEFNRSWPCSILDDSQSYVFMFDARGELVDTDVPEANDGQEALAMADDCRALIGTGARAAWMHDCLPYEVRYAGLAIGKPWSVSRRVSCSINPYSIVLDHFASKSDADAWVSAQIASRAPATWRV